MATVSSLSGQSSIYTLVSQLMTLERAPITRLQTKKSDLQTQGGVFSDLKNKLNALNASVTSLIDAVNSPVDARAVSSSNAAVATATAASGTAIGSHSLFVSQLAKSHTLVSNQIAADGASLRTALGTGDQTFSITVAGETTSVTVTIGESDTDATIVANTASAINAALANAEHPVGASAVTDTASTRKLVLRSGETGASYKMSLADTAGGLLAQLGIANESVAATDTTGGYIYADSALNALFTIDGVSVNRDSNVVSDAISGVTITLKAAQETGDSAVALAVAPDTGAITATIQDFLTKYNDTLTYLRTKTAIDTSTGKRSALGGQNLYRSLVFNLRTTAAASVATGVSGVGLLSEIGITQDRNGALSLSDSGALNAALTDHPEAVAALFNGADGIAARLADVLSPFVKVGGYLQNDQDTLNERVKNIDASVSRLEAKMAIREKMLIAQYSNLNAALAQLSGQTNYLASFLQSNLYQ